MKYLFILLTSIALGNIACRKNTSCVQAEIQTYDCSQFAIKVENTIYPSSNIPSEFQQTGLHVCITYELYEDMRACPSPCCGGTWANIKSIKLAD